MKYRENEKGVALLLALGFAALLLVLIMGFATNALIERKVAANNGDKTQARGLAMSAVNRAIVAMQYQMYEQTRASYDQGLHRFDNIVSKRDNATAAEVFSDSDIADMFYEISTNRHLFKYRNHFYIYEYPKKDDFDYSYNDNGEVITVNEYNKMRRPQWQYVKNTDSTPQIIGRFWYAVLPDLGRISQKTYGSVTEKKGYSVKEFDESQLGFAPADSDFSFEHIAEWAANSTAEDTQSYKNKAFSVFNSIEPLETKAVDNIRGEYYRNSKDPDKDKFEKKMFNILSDKIAADSGYDDLIDQVEYLSSKNTALSENERKTVAANIIGMFKKDPSLSDISDSSDWKVTAPTFTGNRRTPYLNEIEVKLENMGGTVTGGTDSDSDGTPEYKITPEVDVVITFELYDPFGAGFGSGAKISWTEFKGKIDFLNGTAVKSTRDIDLTSFSQTVGGSGKYITVTGTVKVTGEAIEDESGFKVRAKLKDFSANWIYERPKSDTDSTLIAVDYVKSLAKDNTAEQGISEELTVSSTTPSANSSGVNVFSAQAKDALFNFADGDWDKSTTSTIGAVNTGVTENPVFNNLSDFARNVNSSKATLADLRYVSAGKIGKTLDILVTDKELLDQLTTMEDSNPQLIDINTRSVNIWKGLLNGIKDNAGNLIIADASIPDLAKAISKNMRPNGFFKRRSEFIDVFTTALSETSLNSIDSPLLVGKMISLCKTEDYPEYVHLIVVAQTVKDNLGLGTVGTFDRDDDAVTSEVRYLVKLRRTKDYKIEIISIEELVE